MVDVTFQATLYTYGFKNEDEAVDYALDLLDRKYHCGGVAPHRIRDNVYRMDFVGDYEVPGTDSWEEASKKLVEYLDPMLMNVKPIKE